MGVEAKVLMFWALESTRRGELQRFRTVYAYDAPTILLLSLWTPASQVYVYL